VILTTDYGFGKMISDANDETADVWIERIDESSAISSESIRDTITKSAVVAIPFRFGGHASSTLARSGNAYRRANKSAM
jgi:hypothetical protein